MSAESERESLVNLLLSQPWANRDLHEKQATAIADAVIAARWLSSESSVKTKVSYRLDVYGPSPTVGVDHTLLRYMHRDTAEELDVWIAHYDSLPDYVTKIMQLTTTYHTVEEKITI